MVAPQYQKWSRYSHKDKVVVDPNRYTILDTIGSKYSKLSNVPIVKSEGQLDIASGESESQYQQRLSGYFERYDTDLPKIRTGETRLAYRRRLSKELSNLEVRRIGEEKSVGQLSTGGGIQREVQQRVVDRERAAQERSQQGILITNILERQGWDTSSGKSGEIVATRGGQTQVISRTGDVYGQKILKIPSGVSYDLSSTPTPQKMGEARFKEEARRESMSIAPMAVLEKGIPKGIEWTASKTIKVFPLSVDSHNVPSILRLSPKTTEQPNLYYDQYRYMGETNLKNPFINTLVNYSLIGGSKLKTGAIALGEASLVKYRLIDKSLKWASGFIPESIEPQLKEEAAKYGKYSKEPSTFLGHMAFSTQKPLLNWMGGYVGGLKRHPTKTVAMTSLFFFLPPVLKGTGGLVAKSKIATTIWTTVEPSAKGLLYGSYLYSIRERMKRSDNPVATFGEISSTELTPMFVGGAVGGYFWPEMEARLAVTKAKSKFISAQKVTTTKALLEIDPYPSAPVKLQYKYFVSGKRYRLPDERGLKQLTSMWHATGDKYAKSVLLSSGASEVPAWYGSSVLSPKFLRVRGSPSIYSYSASLLEPYGYPRAIKQDVLKFTKIPKGFKRTMSDTELAKLMSEYGFTPQIKSGRIRYGKQAEFLLTKAKKGYAYVSPTKKTEIEAVLKVQTPSEFKSLPYYTKIPSVRTVKKYEFFSRRGYTEAVKRVPKFSWKNPKSYYYKITGHKAGTFIKFNITKGRTIPIERRSLGSLPKILSKVKPTNILSPNLKPDYSYGYSSVISSAPIIPVPSSASYSKSSVSSLVSSVTSRSVSKSVSKSYIRRSQSLRRYLRSISRPSYSSSRSMRSSSTSVSSSVVSSGSYASSSVSSYRYVSSSVLPLTDTTTIPKIELFPKLQIGKKKKKIKKSARFRYQPSLVGVGEKLFGKKPKYLTGLEVRPILRI